MKFLILFYVFVSGTAFSAEILRDVLDRQNEDRHHERKKWDLNKKECKATYPMWFDSAHADYDKHFECTKLVKAEQNAYEDKLQLELCEKFRVSCKN